LRCKDLRIAIFYGGQDFALQPLSRAEVLGIIDEEQKVVEQYENPAPEMGSQAVIEGLIELGAKAVIVRDDTLSQSEYKALKGQVKFMPTQLGNLYDVLEHLEEVKQGAKDQLEGLEQGESAQQES
jgi:predicted Fe-Mo cluster-binding NifX family protein